MVNLEAFRINLSSAARPLCTIPCCLLAKMASLFLSSLSSVSSHKAQECPQVHLLTQTSLFTEALECSSPSGRLCITWALSVMPLLSASSLNQAQSNCTDQELGYFQVLHVFSNYQKLFQLFSVDFKRKSGARCLDSTILTSTFMWPRNDTEFISFKIRFYK